MAQVSKANPTVANTGRSMAGKTMHGLTVDIALHAISMVNELGPNGVVQDIISTVSRTATVLAYSAVRTDGATAGQLVDIWVEGDFPTTTYDGTNAETLAAFLQSEIRLKTTSGIRTADDIAVSGESANAAGSNLNATTVVDLGIYPANG